MLVGLIRSKIVAVFLGPSGMGLLSLFNTTVQLLSNGTNLGIGMSAVKELSEADSKEKILHKIAVIRTWSLIVAALGFVVTILAAPIINSLSFTWGEHTFHFMALAPIVAVLAITGGEAAILKATRRLKNLATVQLITVISSVVFSIPIYYFFGETGIVPVIFLSALATMIATIFYSYRYYPFKISGIRKYIKEGSPMVKLGLSFVAAGILGSGVEMYIRAFLNSRGDLDMVGLYFAAFSIAITYPSALLNSLENDYFARLSAINTNNKEVCRMVNAQVEVLLMVMIPVLGILMVVLPVVIPLLFSAKFNDAIPMAQITMIAMFLRTASLPIEYISLAKGEAKTYLFIEIISNIVIAVCLTIGFNNFKLWGMGAGWVASYALVLISTLVYFHHRWNFRLSFRALAMLIAGAAILTGIYLFIK